MKNIIERFNKIDKPESTKRMRLGKYCKLMDEGYNRDEINSMIKGLSDEEAEIYYHLYINRKESK